LFCRDFLVLTLDFNFLFANIFLDVKGE